MIIDGSQLFTGTSNGASGGITLAFYTDAPTTGTQAASNIIDYGLTGGLPGVVSGTVGGGGARDMGIGDKPSLKVTILCTTTFVGGTSCQFQLQGAPDAGNNTAGTYYTLWTSFAFLTAQLLAGAVLGNIDFPRELIYATTGGGPIRYLKLNFISVGTYSASGIEAFIALDQEQAIFAGVSGVVARSGYPAGINIAN